MKSFEKLPLLIIVCLISFFPYSSSFGDMEKSESREGHSILYKPEKQEVISGEVISIEGPIRGWCEAVHITVQTEKGPVLVHLTSRKYVTDKTNTIELKDKVEIKGSRSSYGNMQVFIAAEVKKENYILKIWNDEGSPVSESWVEQ
jgi:hypothetical protein